MTTKEKAEKLFKKVGTFILTCVDADGFPITKAVVPAKYRESFNDIYFCTNTSSKFARAIMNNPKSCIYFYSKALVWKGCTMQGNMEIVTDINVKQKYWQDKFKNAYAEKSYTDPDFCLLKFTANSGRYYEWYKPTDFEI